MNENESTILTVTDEDGTEYYFEILDETIYNETRYFAMIEVSDPEGETEPEDPQSFILKEQIDPKTGETTLATIDDDDEYENVAEQFDRQFAEREDEEDEETDGEA